MSEKQREELFSKIKLGLKIAHEKMLREKALHGQSVIYADEKGCHYKIPAAEALRQFESKSTNGKS